MNEDETRHYIERCIKDLDTFLASEYYNKGFLPGLRQEILDTKENIVINVPVGDEAQAKDLILRGELAQLISSLSYFEEARAHLKAKLDVKSESENESTTKHI